MNESDLKEHFNKTLKQITKTCHETCFNFKESELDKKCALLCFDNFVKTLSEVNINLIEMGKLTNSEFLVKGYKFNENEKEILLFPYGGTRIMNPVIPFKYFAKSIYPVEGKNEFKPEYFWR